jgi:hypothetical protein
VAIRILVGLLTLALTAWSAPLAAARSAHRVNLRFYIAQVLEPSSKLVDAGTVTGTFGRGAVVARSTIPGGVVTPGMTISGRTMLWYVAGTLASKGTITLTAQPDGSTSYTGSGDITGGTGKFAGATGNGTVTGTSPINDFGHATLNWTGTVAY